MTRVRSNNLKSKTFIIFLFGLAMMFSIFQVIITPMPNETTREFELFQLRLKQLEKQKGDDFLKNKLILRRTSAQEELEMQMDIEKTNEIKLKGIKELPSRFKVLGNDNTQVLEYEFVNVPLRVTNAYGLLHTRNLQGHTFAGSFMKGAFLIFVKSSVNHVLRRNIARKTYASIKDVQGWKIETIFVMGEDDSMQHVVNDENKRYGDILQYKGKDFPKETLTKYIASLQWVTQTLPADFVVAFTSDDVITNIGMLRDHVDKYLTTVKPPNRLFVTYIKDGSTVVTGQRQTLYCFDEYKEKDKVNRSTNEEMFISKTDYDGDYWPPYCREGLYFMPVSLATDIYETACLFEKSVKSIPAEIFITGIVRRLLDRGDENIQFSFTNMPQQNQIPFKRFPELSKNILREKEADEKLEIIIFELWNKWYEKLKGVFHVYTTID